MDGSLSVTTKKSTGTGSWAVAGDTELRFSLREDFNLDFTQISPTGHRAAYIRIDFTARHHGDTITGEGRAVVHGTDDSVIYGTDATTDVRRLS